MYCTYVSHAFSEPINNPLWCVKFEKKTLNTTVHKNYPGVFNQADCGGRRTSLGADLTVFREESRNNWLEKRQLK